MTGVNVLVLLVIAQADSSAGPTGEEFVSGSYDRTIRLWNRDAGKSRDIYHTKRMQRVFDVTYTPTAEFILSASDDGNVRIWKSDSSHKLGAVSTKERQSMEYRKALVDRWSSTSGVRAVNERRHVPQSIHSATKLKRDMIESRNVKEDRRRKHSRAGREKPKAERKSECNGAILGLQTDRTCRGGHCRAKVRVWLVSGTSFRLLYIWHARPEISK